MVWRPSLLALLTALGAPVARPDELADAQAAVSTARSRLVDFAGRRAELSARLERLAAQIAEQKRRLPEGAPPSPELGELLRRSVDLAGQIEAVDRQLSAFQAALPALQDRLARGCEETTRRLLAGLERAAPEGRPAIERDLAGVRATCLPLERTPAAPKPSIPAGALRAAQADDAQALREKADFLRDREDRLRRQIDRMNDRIAGLSRERALDRRISELVREQGLFDDDDRRISVSRTEYAGGSPTPSGSPKDASGTSQSMAPSATGGAASAPAPGGGGNGAGGAGAPPSGGLSGGGSADVGGGGVGPATTKETLSGSRPEEVPLGDDAAGDDESLDGLRAQRQALEREAARLHEAAQALERAAAIRR